MFHFSGACGRWELDADWAVNTVWKAHAEKTAFTLWYIQLGSFVRPWITPKALYSPWWPVALSVCYIQREGKEQKGESHTKRGTARSYTQKHQKWNKRTYFGIMNKMDRISSAIPSKKSFKVLNSHLYMPRKSWHLLGWGDNWIEMMTGGQNVWGV